MIIPKPGEGRTCALTGCLTSPLFKQLARMSGEAILGIVWAKDEGDGCVKDDCEDNEDEKKEEPKVYHFVVRCLGDSLERTVSRYILKAINSMQASLHLG